MSKITIIGSGFMGSAIANVIKFNNLSVEILSSKEFDLCRPDTWSLLSLDTEKVIIAAGEISEDIKRLQEVNEKPVESLCEFLKEKKIKDIIVLSTGAVYGDYNDDAYSGMPCEPNSNYGKSKLAAENLFIKYWDGGLNILRLYFPYGAKQKIPRLVPNLINKIQNGLPILINNDGGPTISLSHVDDLADIIVQDFVLNKNHTLINNLASSYKISIFELAKQLSLHIGKEPVFEIKDQNSKNCTSVPYKYSWAKTGEFASLFI